MNRKEVIIQKFQNHEIDPRYFKWCFHCFNQRNSFQNRKLFGGQLERYLFFLNIEKVGPEVKTLFTQGIIKNI